MVSLDSNTVAADIPLALEDETFRKTRPQKSVDMISAGQGTPRRFTRVKIRGAFPSMASPYSVRDAMYKSEFAALSTKRRMAALMIWFRTLIPASVVARYQ